MQEAVVRTLLEKRRRTTLPSHHRQDQRGRSFPKASPELSADEDIPAAADGLNGRPRIKLGCCSPEGSLRPSWIPFTQPERCDDLLSIPGCPACTCNVR